jgi:hypothetical protein
MKYDGERNLILGWMHYLGLIYDLAREADPKHTVRNSMKFFQELSSWLQEKGLVYPEAVPAGVGAEVWNQIPMMFDYAVDIFGASRAIGLREGIEGGYGALSIAEYYKRFPERFAIAKYVRKSEDVGPEGICRFMDTQEDRIVATLPPSDALRFRRPYPLPWESQQLQTFRRLQEQIPATERELGKWSSSMRQVQKRIFQTKQDLDRRMRWAHALDKNRNELKKVKYLRSFLSKEKALALRNEDAQMFFAWRQSSTGRVIEPDPDPIDGFRQLTFGDSWLQVKQIGVKIPPALEEILRAQEAANKVQASRRGRRLKS